MHVIVLVFACARSLSLARAHALSVHVCGEPEAFGNSEFLSDKQLLDRGLLVQAEKT
jgi:hypothetical protein